MNRIFLSRTRTLVVLTFGVISCGGCSLLPKGGNDIAGPTMPLQGSPSAEAFKRVQEAKSQNAIVLQVTGDSQPIRVLPLPSDGTPVFVSDLLRQTGIQDKMGRMLVTVHRSSPSDYQGAKMEVRFSDDGSTIRPETDYSLQSGDRIRIAKDPTTVFGSLMEQIIPINTKRGMAGS